MTAATLDQLDAITVEDPNTEHPTLIVTAGKTELLRIPIDGDDAKQKAISFAEHLLDELYGIPT